MAGKKALLFLFISYEGNRLKKSTKISLPVEKWDVNKQQVKRSHSKSMEINAYLNQMISKIENIYFDNVRQGKFKFNQFKPLVESELFPNQTTETEKQVEKKTLNVLTVFEEFIEARSVEVTKGTLKRIKVIYGHLKKYQTKSRKKLSFENLDLIFLEKFKAYLIRDAKIENNTSARYLKYVKTFMNWSAKRGYLKNTDYKEFKVKMDRTEIIYLTEDEFMALFHLDLTADKTLEKVRDVFCFGCFTGQRYSDLAALRRTHIQGNVWHLRTQKTKEIIQIPLSPLALKILDKYKGQERPLPIMTNQRTNIHIKEVCKLAEIDTPITKVRYRGAERIEETAPKYQFIATHTARRTFTTYSLEKGMSNAEVMAITGHKDLKTFQQYSGSNPQAIQLKMTNIWAEKTD